MNAAPVVGSWQYIQVFSAGFVLLGGHPEEQNQIVEMNALQTVGKLACDGHLVHRARKVYSLIRRLRGDVRLWQPSLAELWRLDASFFEEWSILVAPLGAIAAEAPCKRLRELL